MANREDGEKERVKALCESIGFGRVMQLAEECWGEYAQQRGHPGSQHTTGPCASLMVSCGCDGGCDWCGGSGRVTKRVKRAKGLVHEAQVIDLKAALEDVKAALGDRLLAKGPLSEVYAHSVMRKINGALGAKVKGPRPVRYPTTEDDYDNEL